MHRLCRHNLHLQEHFSPLAAHNFIMPPPSGLLQLVLCCCQRLLMHLMSLGAMQNPYIKRPKKANFHRFFYIFSAVFPNIWPLAGPNIAKKGGPLQKLARGDRQTHFGTFNFWLKPGFYCFLSKTTHFGDFFGPKGGCASSRLDHGFMDMHMQDRATVLWVEEDIWRIHVRRNPSNYPFAR